MSNEFKEFDAVVNTNTTESAHFPLALQELASLGAWHPSDVLIDMSDSQ